MARYRHGRLLAERARLEILQSAVRSLRRGLTLLSFRRLILFAGLLLLALFLILLAAFVAHVSNPFQLAIVVRGTRRSR